MAGKEKAEQALRTHSQTNCPFSEGQQAESWMERTDPTFKATEYTVAQKVNSE